MRIIKFRCWDEKKKKMYHNVGISNTGTPMLWIDKGGGATFLGDTGKGLPILMQYTGLKDKNGKEIWEGDILHFKGNVYSGTPGEFDKKDMILPVVYKDNKGFQMYLIGFCYYEIYSHEVEVIGNIFENKELLKRIADWKHL